MFSVSCTGLLYICVARLSESWADVKYSVCRVITQNISCEFPSKFGKEEANVL